MKHKKTLFIVFFLVLFVFQQTRVNAEVLPDMGNLFSNQSPQASGLPDKVLVYMYQFTVDGEPTTFPCLDEDTTLGCVESFSNLTYPPDSPYVTFPSGGVNPILVDVENYYLKNVLPREMNVAENYPTLAALQAQALAARSIADWKPRAFGADTFTNTTFKQVFVPGSYEKYLNPENPVEIQNRISDAITSTNGQYLSYNGNGESIDAEFGSDWLVQTSDEPSKDYLEVVQDPISSTVCGAINNNGGYGGMSQKGAIRWSLGNQCAAGGDNSTKWSVQWTDYRQILAHYYTGIDILDGNGGKVAPDDRWNLLWHDNFGSPIGSPLVLTSEGQYNISLILQNTSTSEWNGANIEIGYHWGDQVWHIAPNNLLPNSYPKGKETETFIVQIVAPSTNGVHTLHLDLRHKLQGQSD
ncbi:MAG: Stage sporulation protein, partial [Bacteroidota bacterium]